MEWKKLNSTEFQGSVWIRIVRFHRGAKKRVFVRKKNGIKVLLVLSISYIISVNHHNNDMNRANIVLSDLLLGTLKVRG